MPQTTNSPLPADGLRLDDVTLVRGTRRVFERLTLHLSERRIGLIGDNGAGKSSLFRLLCGLDRPDAGRVWVHGLDTTSERRQLPRHIGLMFQNPDDQIIFPTVAEELAFSLMAQGAARAEARAQAKAFLAQRGLSDWAGRAVGELSQGQRQQVCLLALQICSPRTLLLDEPFASLDLPSQARLSAQLAATEQQVVVSTHQLDTVRDFERVLWLADGQVRADGSGQAVCAAYVDDVRARADAEPPRHGASHA